MELRYAVGSDAGIRAVNQDSVYAAPHVLAVADGMGGHAHGEVASAVVIGVVSEIRSTTDPLATLAGVVAESLRRLTELAARDDELTGMGSTLTALLWTGSGFGLAHVGDSRGYLLRDDTLRQLTHDHTLVQSLVDDGQITAAQAQEHPRRSMLMRAIQTGGAATPDLSTVDAMAGDRYLLCSDGVTCVVGPDGVHGAMTAHAEPKAVVRHLIEEAKRLGSPDNISCVVADVIESPNRWARISRAVSRRAPVPRGPHRTPAS